MKLYYRASIWTANLQVFDRHIDLHAMNDSTEMIQIIHSNILKLILNYCR